MSNSDLNESRGKQIFISYSNEDRDIARQLAHAINDAGLNVWFDEWELQFGDSIVKGINDALNASDIMLVLLSPHSVQSIWLKAELNAFLVHELRDRAITIIPALIEDCDVPSLLADRKQIDLRKDIESGIERLVEQLSVSPDIDFSRLDARSFEILIGDLLVELGFSIQRMPVARDSGFDFIATHSTRDPFGALKESQWIVETKLYKDQRVSVEILRQMVGYLMILEKPYRGLVVTSGRLTSVAREYLDEISGKLGGDLRVVDGTELTNLLIQHPHLVVRYFTAKEDE